MKKAYENWNQVIEYDGESLVNFKQTKRLRSSRSELPVDYPNALEHQLQLPRLPSSASNEQDLAVGGNHVWIIIDDISSIWVEYSLFNLSLVNWCCVC